MRSLVWRCLITAAVLMTASLGLMAASQCPASLDPTDWQWDAVQAAPVSGGFGQGIVGAGDHVYLVKCLYASSTPEVHRYDPVADRWEVSSTDGLTTGVFRNGTALTWDGDSTIYALAGARYSDSFRREFWQYSLDTRRWKRLPDTPYDQGAGNAITWSEYDGQIYAIVGSRHSNHNRGHSYFLRYDPATTRWTTLPFDWTATDDGAALAWAGEYVYALQGEVDELNPSRNRGFARFHIPSGTWEQLPELPDPGGVGDGGSLLWIGASCPELSDFVFALGGGAADETPGSGFYSYTISQERWTSLDGLPCAVGYYVGPRLAFANGRIYYWQGERQAQPCEGKGFYRLSPPAAVDPGEVTRVITNTSGSRTGGGSDARGVLGFSHVARMTELSEGRERTVFVFARGNEHTFTCAVLGPDNEAVWRTVFELDRDAAGAFTDKVISESDDVIRGVTESAMRDGQRYSFVGSITEVSGEAASGSWAMEMDFPERIFDLHIEVREAPPDEHVLGEPLLVRLHSAAIVWLVQPREGAAPSIRGFWQARYNPDLDRYEVEIPTDNLSPGRYEIRLNGEVLRSIRLVE